MPGLLAHAVFATALMASAHAALYPNRPVANTVYEAGKEATVSWIDDGSRPHLNELPKLQLDLYGPNDVRLSHLQEDSPSPADK